MENTYNINEVEFLFIETQPHCFNLELRQTENKKVNEYWISYNIPIKNQLDFSEVFNSYITGPCVTISKNKSLELINSFNNCSLHEYTLLNVNNKLELKNIISSVIGEFDNCVILKINQ